MDENSKKTAETTRPQRPKTVYSGVEALMHFPNCGNVKHLANHQYDYRLRIGRYRVFFEFQSTVKIIKIEEVKKGMSEHIKILESDDGKPLFAVVPYDEYLELVNSRDREITIPHAVVGANVIDGKSMVRAWREYKKITQAQMAKKLGITQAAYSQMEKPDAKLRRTTLEKIAAAMGILTEQLTE